MKLEEINDETIFDIVNVIKVHTIDDPIGAAEIAELIGIKVTKWNYQVREGVRRAIIDYGVPIGSNTGGFFIIESLDQLNECTAKLRSKINSLIKRVTALESAYIEHHKQKKKKKLIKRRRKQQTLI